MATVRLSMSLRDDIRRKAESAFDAAHPHPVMSEADIARLVTAIKSASLYKTLTDIAAVVKAAKEREEQSSVGFDFLGLETFNAELKSRNHLILYFRDDGSHPEVPQLRRHQFRHNVTLPAGTELTCISYNNEVATPYFEDAERAYFDQLGNQLMHAIRAYSEKREQYIRQIRSLLERCNTLKQVLTIWPQAEIYVPDSAMQQHRSKVEVRQSKTQTIADEIDFDASTANAVAVRARLTGGI